VRKNEETRKTSTLCSKMLVFWTKWQKKKNFEIIFWQSKMAPNAVKTSLHM
jgi:hypothetical protein